MEQFKLVSPFQPSGDQPKAIAALTRVIGIVKAYTTRVGSGPFPTELLDETGDYLRNTAHEFGTVTGRPRRIGWLDTRAVRYAAELNTFDYLAITRLDILDDMDEIKVCVGYEYEGKEVEEYPFPFQNPQHDRVSPHVQSQPEVQHPCRSEILFLFEESSTRPAADLLFFHPQGAGTRVASSILLQ